MTENEDKSNNQYWGLGATIAFSLLILLAFIVTQSIAFVLYASNKFSEHPSTDETTFFNSLLSNGDAVSMVAISSAIVGIAVTFLLILLHRRQSIEAYLHLYPINIQIILRYLATMLIMVVFMGIVATLVDHPTPQIMLDIYHSAKQPALLFFALIIAAPFFEEILFRGFLFEGLRHSSVGFLGAAMITSAVWAGIHLQYGLYEIVTIFFIGLILAYAKAKTGSLYVPIAMHSFMNFVAIVEIELNLG